MDTFGAGGAESTLTSGAGGSAGGGGSPQGGHASDGSDGVSVADAGGRDGGRDIEEDLMDADALQCQCYNYCACT